MNITFRQLRLFLAVAEAGSVTAAARAMHVTQPTASAQLREMTLAVGTPLYEVVARRVRLTEAGEELARTARSIADEWNSFSERIDGLKGLTRGRLRVAVVSTAEYFIPRLLGSFCTNHPGVDIALEVQNRDGVVTRLGENRDDLYIMSTPPVRADLEATAFMPNPLVVIASTRHALAKRRQLSLQDLANQPFILREKGSGTRMSVDKHFRKHRFKPEIRMELGTNEAIRGVVAGGLGLSVLSRHALRGSAEETGVVELKVTGFPVQSQWYVVHARGRRLSPVAAVFREHLLAQSGHW